MQQLQAREAHDLLQADRQALLLDVREAWELGLARAKLPASQFLHLPMAVVPLSLDHIPRAQPIVCICHHGARSAQVVAFLQQQGYAQVYNLAGGIDAWSVSVDPDVPRY